MKISSNRVESFLQNPDPKIGLVVVYGPDNGLVAERCQRLGKAAVDDLADPFSVVELSVAAMTADRARLNDEARAMSFGGGRRLVRIRGGTDSISTLLKDYLNDPASQTMVIVDAGELTPRSSLRKLAESHAAAAALPCYKIEGRALESVITGILGELGVSADRAALSMLTGRLGTDRALLRQELEKLALYAGGHSETGPKQIGPEDVENCLTDSSEVSLDRLAFAVADGKTGEADSCLQKSLAKGASEIEILRSLQRHFQRLDWVVSQAESGQTGNRHAGNGKNVSALVAGLRPPVFFLFKDRFERQAQKWSAKAVHRAMGILLEAELACKSTTAPAPLICGRAVLSLCRTQTRKR